MDLSEGLPSASYKFTILIIVDQLSEYAYFLVVPHPYTSITIVELYFAKMH